MTTTTEPDPYAPRPTFFERHADPIAATAVFVLTVLLAVASFPPFHTPEAAYVMLVPGVFWAYRAPRLKLYAWTLGAAQAVAWTIILGWLHHVTWLGLFLLGPFTGLWIGCWYLAAWWTMPRMLRRPTFTRLVAMLGLGAAWVIVEWTRTWLLSGFPWLPLAASQWQRPSILQVAAYTGSYGVSFVLVAANVGFAAYAHRLFLEGASGFNKRSQEFFLALFLLMACLCIHFQDAFNRMRYAEGLARVAFVQPDIPQSVKWDESKAGEIGRILQDTTLAAAQSHPDLILWPEASTPWAVRGNANMQAFAEALAKRAGVPLLIGSLAIEDPGTPKERWYNGAFVVSPQAGLQQEYYAKRHLVPFGEYVPFRPVLGWLQKVVPVGAEDFQAGLDSSPVLVDLHGHPTVIGPLICYEDVYPELARYSVRAGASVLTVLTNNGWFGRGGAAYQHAAHSVLRAVEFRRPVLRCGNAGWSGWIDEFGSIRAVLTQDAQGQVHTEFKPDDEGTIYFRGTGTVNVTRDSRWANTQSFYARHGDWFVLVSAGLILFGLLALKLSIATPVAVDQNDAAGS